MNKLALTVSIITLCSINVAAAEQATTDNDPREFATKILKTYLAKDVEGLLKFSTDGPVTPRMLQRMSPGSGRYNSMFGKDSWRWKVVSEWNGKLKAIKYHRTAMVQFTKAEGPRKPTFVTLTMEGNQWKFRAIEHSNVRDVLSPMSGNFKLPNHSKLTPALTGQTTQVLKAHQKRDFAAVIKLSTAEGPYALTDMNETDQNKTKSERLFNQKNMTAVTKWDGKIQGIYLYEMARVEFARDAESVYVVTLVRTKNGWKFEDIHSPETSDFETMND